MKTNLILLILIVSAMISWLYADDLQSTMEQLSGTAGKFYVNPFSQSVAVDFNGGWFHKVPKAELFGWDLEFGVVGMGSLFNGNEKTFDTPNAKFRFTRDQAMQLTSQYSGTPGYDALLDAIVQTDFNVGIQGPTIIGDKYDEATGANAIHVIIPATDVNYLVYGIQQTATVPAQDYSLGVGGLLGDLPAMPLAAPQLTLGTIAGTQISLRYLPNTTLDAKIGLISYLGYGIQHNPAFWLPIKLPVDVAIAFFTQDLKVGDLAELTGTTVGMNIAKTFGYKMLSFSPYAGINAETATMKFHYNYEVQTAAGPLNNHIAFQIDGKNSTRATFGLNFRLGLINLNFDYNLGKYQSATTGIMFNFSF
jgi:hypothetical protein